MPSAGTPIRRWRSALTRAERTDGPSLQSGPEAEQGAARTALPDAIGSSADVPDPDLAVDTDPTVRGEAPPAWSFTDEFERPQRGSDFAGSLASGARSRLAAELERRPGSFGSASAARAASGLSAALVEEIEILVFRTLTLEERIAGLENGSSESATSRFNVELRRPEARRRLFETYPGLLRQLHLRCDRWVAACIEMADRLRSDRASISRVFGIRADDEVMSATMAHGDAHLGGRRVVILRFASGLRLVYKPRPVEAAERFQALLALLNQRGLNPAVRTISVLACDGYGWMEHVSGRSCRSDAGVDRYYRRAGALIAALHAAGATDCHFENVLADGEHPVVVDLETLMRPRLGASPDTATARATAEIDASVMAIGILPSIDGGDLGAFAVEANQSTRLTTLGLIDAGTPTARVESIPWQLGDVLSLPRRRGGRVGPSGRVCEIERGFVDAYGIIEAARDALLAPGGILAGMGRSHVRVVLRPTAYYSDILFGCSHPVALHDAAAIDRITSRLDAPAGTLLAAAAPDELQQLLLADVPYFGLPADARNLSFCHRDGRLSATLPCSGLESARARLAGFGRSDLARQRGLLRIAFGAQPEADRTDDAPYGPLESAARVGDALLAGAVRLGDAASWLHVVEPNGAAPRRIEPTDPWLYDGLLGISLFLGQLAAATGDGRYRTAAAAAALEARRRIKADAGSAAGVFEGMGGLVYALSHLALLLGDEGLAVAAEYAADAVVPSIEGRLLGGDLVSGTAGLALAGLSLDAVRPSETSRRMLSACEADLIDRANGTIEARLPFVRGASHGWSGVLLALARLHAARPNEKLADALDRVASYEIGLTAGDRWTDLEDADHEGQNSWCHGAAGIALCRTSAAASCGIDRLDEAARAAVVATCAAELAGLSGLGLCHGAPGVFEAVLASSRAGLLPGRYPPGADLPLPVLGEASSGVDVFRPGLMTGLSGLGHAFLKVHDASIACVLTLEAPHYGPKASHEAARAEDSATR